MLTTAPGLETAAADEATHKINAHVQQITRGKVFIRVSDKPFPIKKIRSADNIYKYLFSGEMSHTRDALAKLADQLADEKHHTILKAYLTGKKYFTVNASVAGKHNYSRFEAAEAFSRIIVKKYCVNPTDAWDIDKQKYAAIEFRLDIQGERFMLSVKLTDAAYRFRGAERGFTKAALRPTVAHALVWLSRPRAGEVFMDPFCGSGTILCERAVYPYGKIIGIEYNENVMSAAEHNLQSVTAAVHQIPPADLHKYLNPAVDAETPALLLTAVDARSVEIPAASVDVIVTNPPWGRQIKSENEPLSDDVPRLYSAFLASAARFMKPGGRIIMLSSLEEAVCQSAASAVFSVKILCTVSLHGVLCRVFQLTAD
jgi:23S rRNA G2445 N2-methylase RlmL